MTHETSLPLILGVEDDRAIANVLAACLEEHGYEVVCAGDAYAALRAWEVGTSPNRPGT
jgi:CheY-like chemotaxis protein